MKKNIILILVGLLITTANFAQKDNPVFLKINGKEIRKTEFLNIYTKNNNDPKYDKASLDEYLKLFVKYKLKVTDAEQLKVDTIPRLKNELAGYEKQASNKYLTDTEMTEELIKEAYERKKIEVKASHILITKESTESGDVYSEAIRIRKEILKTGNFEAAALKYSKDPSARGSNGNDGNKGDLGYFSAFQMVYSFEEGAYNTKVGEISMPVKSKYGYHLIKVYDKRLARGKMKAAHIYSKIPTNASEQAQKMAKGKIDEIYTILLSGKQNFEDLAKEHSDDRTSAAKGGELPWFESGKMVPEFENAAFNLQNDEDYSKPFKTSYGWHIVKRLKSEPIGNFEQLRPEIVQKINRGDRAAKSEESFTNKLKKQYRFKDKSKKWIADLYDSKTLTLSSDYDDKTAFKYKKTGKFWSKSTKVSVSDFKDFIQKNPVGSTEDVKDKYKKFVIKYMMDYEKSTLEDRFPKYKAQMQEYHDGVLLFELTEQKVWKKATEDTTGLKEYYENNKQKYQWKKRVDAEIYSSSKIEQITKALVLAKDSNFSASKTLQEINKSSNLNLSVQKGKYEIEKKQILNLFELKKGVSEFKLKDGKFHFVKINELLPAGNKELKETRGHVISDYQNYLEKEWVKELNEKYSIEIFYDAIYSLGAPKK